MTIYSYGSIQKTQFIVTLFMITGELFQVVVLPAVNSAIAYMKYVPVAGFENDAAEGGKHIAITLFGVTLA
jgi:hypothetical protein